MDGKTKVQSVTDNLHWLTSQKPTEVEWKRTAKAYWEYMVGTGMAFSNPGFAAELQKWADLMLI